MDSFLHNHQSALDSQREEDFKEESCQCNWEDKYD